MSKTLYRVGYTEGFNDGLENKCNVHLMPEEEWVPVEKRNPRNIGLQRDPNRTVDIFDPEVEKVMRNSYKVCYNWGYKHGVEERQHLSLKYNEVELNRITNEFSNAFRIIYLEINDNTTPFFMMLDSNAERKYRAEFIESFLNKKESISPDKAQLDEINEYLNNNKLQRAIDSSIKYFRTQKQLTNYCESLMLGSRLRNLRNNLKTDQSDKEKSENEKRLIIEWLTKIIKELTP